MTTRGKAIALIVIQCLLVSSIAAKYIYERATLPRVWVRTVQFDPELPMRGRYLALSPVVDVCSLNLHPPANIRSPHWYDTPAVQLVAHNGHLVAINAAGRLPRNDYQHVVITDQTPCDRARTFPGMDYFIPENALSPFPLKPGQELWAEVTVPPSGPPRPIQLALSDNGKWQVLQFEH
jgi:hypothetical protein